VPLIVHFHSPMELVVGENGFDPRLPHYARQIDLETSAILWADAWLCPSSFLANQVAQHYGITRDAIQVIPYPVGLTVPPARSSDVWTHGTICYVGRLEARKGVREWVTAAAAAAQDNPSLQFTLIGDDTPVAAAEGRPMSAVLKASIPAASR